MTRLPTAFVGRYFSATQHKTLPRQRSADERPLLSLVFPSGLLFLLKNCFTPPLRVLLLTLLKYL